MTMVPST